MEACCVFIGEDGYAASQVHSKGIACSKRTSKSDGSERVMRVDWCSIVAFNLPGLEISWDNRRQILLLRANPRRVHSMPVTICVLTAIVSGPADSPDIKRGLSSMAANGDEKNRKSPGGAILKVKIEKWKRKESWEPRHSLRMLAYALSESCSTFKAACCYWAQSCACDIGYCVL